MEKLSILDCTLRDGGYVNNWDFGYENIRKIIQNLVSSNIEYIECGFLEDTFFSKEKTIFTDIDSLSEIAKDFISTKFLLMINFGSYPIEKIQECKNKNFLLRIAFKKEESNLALDFCKKIKEKGYNFFINPMHTNFYSKKEIIELVEKVNEILPYAFTIVDTTGAMREKDVVSLFKIVNEVLDNKIKLCFHSHNNLQLSFTNAQALIKENSSRDLIIDSTIFGMGRGAGNIQTEQITKYFNDNYHKGYNLLPVLRLIDETINPIYNKTPWGYSVPYYLAATNHCHPNYAKFLSNKRFDVEKIDKILREIPQDKKLNYDEIFIKSKYDKSLL